VILYVVRHADAVRSGGAIQRDVDRPLSPRGEEDAVLMARVLTGVANKPGAILTSPLVRAVRTGQIFREALGGEVTAGVSENLSPGFRPKALMEELRRPELQRPTLVIGHQPDVGGLVGSLIADSRQASVAMAACAVACLSFESDTPASPATLLWLLTPDAVRAARS
jgi:phosphohistidine phosphatase